MKKKFVPVTTTASVLAKGGFVGVAISVIALILYYFTALDTSVQWTIQETQTLFGLMALAAVFSLLFYFSSNQYEKEVVQQKKEQGII